MQNDEQIKVLVVDDEENMRVSLSRILRKKNYFVEAVESAEKAIIKYRTNSFDVVISDLKMPNIDGMDLLKRLREEDSGVIFIMITGYSSIATAISAIRLGAYDYIPKPFEVEEVDLLIRKAYEQKRMKDKVDYFSSMQTSASDVIVGESQCMADIYKLIHQVAVSDATVLVTGEPGTGKELIAKAIHRLSNRNDELFVPVNCAALSETLLESELFGHEKGSFTGAIASRKGLFEIASGGTLFLDEIGEISKYFQVKLLRVLQEREFKRVGGSRDISTDVRIVAATNKDLTREVAEGNFRQDLYYRLNVFPIGVPSLKERVNDIPLLANYFTKRFAEKLKKNISGISDDALMIMMRYPWPGNVRELENVIERAVILESESKIMPAALKSLATQGSPAAYDGSFFFNNSFKPARQQFEKHYLEYHLERCGGNISELARRIDVHRTSVYEMLRKYDIEIRS
ncbi:MAG: hypothetical protein CVV64_03120 [Candidatus Wallbacteria bacterium HGW-Wallbacteria-1]|jgi:DNA-binding NtrC family response regulator|uniref:Fis family transcriptional regulator n=1 Tax=Candidatus Wallbacteria bacterium HGW-Wallbacteria-1 TaxID=2013854 RepID=A0A2N1PTK7_9BACT|nr:MAG: hypothetical protein CVV64_03120 [Candidatus Wallbacteria bacterium HGW-Wallbacteria-1]